MGVVLFFYGVVDFQGWLIFWQNRDTNKILCNGFEFINHIHIQSFQETYVCSTTHLEINDYTTKSKYYVKNISVFRKIRCINENHKVSMKCFFFLFLKKWIFFVSFANQWIFCNELLCSQMPGTKKKNVQVNAWNNDASASK